MAADLLWAVLWAGAERDAAFAGVTDAQIAALLDDEGSPEGAAVVARVDVARVRAAAGALARAVDDARPKLLDLTAGPAQGPAPAQGPLVDVFPILGIDPLGVDNAFPHDYLLSIDLGGNDAYDNNAGGGLIARGFTVGDPSTFGPNVGGFIVGGEFEDSGEAYGVTLAIDVAGDDTYGVYKEPGAFGLDKRCTTSPVIRRTVVQGSGAGGIGMLVDLDGHDRYRAKTVAQGTGHVAGVGVLLDAVGDDSYTAVRSAMGVGILAGVGVLVDEAGDDAHAMVAPPGGVWNGDRGRCDAGQRLAMGAGLSAGFGAVGHFLDLGGDDTYRADAQALGFGGPQAVGAFLDAGGADDYGGYAGRGNGAQLATSHATGASLFRDV